MDDRIKLNLENIRKSYDRPVIKNLTYTFESGKIYIIKGVSGCGKSTLLNIIGGVEKDYEGSVMCENREKVRVGYIFQYSLLISKLTVFENLKLISSDETELRNLCELAGISDLIEKFPSALSGGERQRVSIVRALLGHPQIFLLDEPTASLDEFNSENIAEMIAALRSSGRIVIVAAHEDCFDRYADEVISLKYGTIDNVRKSTPNVVHTADIVPDTAVRRRIHPFRYAVKHNGGLFKPGSILPLLFAFLLVMLVSTVQNNFEHEYKRMVQRRYPMNLICMSEIEFDEFSYKDRLTVYDNYTVLVGDVHGYYLPDRSASVFCIKGMITAGRFPESADEILLSRDFWNHFFGNDQNPENCIGKNVNIAGNNYRIAGVTADLSDSDVTYNLFADAYYQRNIESNAVFIPYETISRIGDKKECGFITASCPNLFMDDQLLEYMKETMVDGQPNQFYCDISERQHTVDGIAGIIFIIFLISYVTTCIFLMTIVHSELFSRRRELGYLQIFGLTKAEVGKMAASEYIIKLCTGLASALIVYLVMVGVYFAATGGTVFFNLPFTVGLIAILAAVYLVSVVLAVSFFLRHSVKELIEK